MTLLIVDFRGAANLEKTLEAQERVVKGGFGSRFTGGKTVISHFTGKKLVISRNLMNSFLTA